jgi:hypothetical protein
MDAGIGPESFGVVPTLKTSLSAYDFVGTKLARLTMDMEGET